MPRAVSVPDETVKVKLKSCPGGFVELRKLTFGEILHRRELASKIALEVEQRKRNKGRQQQQQPKGPRTAIIEIIQRAVSKYEFERAIVDHNLEDEKDRKLNFASMHDFEMLDPKIGREIQDHIIDMNGLVDEPDDDDEEDDSGDDVLGEGLGNSDTSPSKPSVAKT